MKTLRTVNVVLLDSGIVQELIAFPATRDGKEASARLFKKYACAINKELTQEDLHDALETGSYDNQAGSEVLLVHSFKRHTR